MKRFGKVLASLTVVALGYLVLSTSAYAGGSYGFSFSYNSGGYSRYSGGFAYGGCAPRYYGGAAYSYCAPTYCYRPAAAYYYAPPPVYYSPTVVYSGGYAYRY